MRRLRILNALAAAVAKVDGKLTLRGRGARNICFTFHQQHLSVVLDSASNAKSRFPEPSIPIEISSEQLVLRLAYDWRSDPDAPTWRDDENGRLEVKLSAIAAELPIVAERNLRNWALHHYEWRVKRKHELEEVARERCRQIEQAERDRIARLKQARIDRLLTQAAALRQAQDIRALVIAVQDAVASGDANVVAPDLVRWSTWATTEADRIDPIRSHSLLEVMNDEDDAGSVTLRPASTTASARNSEPTSPD